MSRAYSWLSAELDTKLLTKPPVASYMELANEINEQLKGVALPPSMEETVRAHMAHVIASIMELRIRKILWEVQQGREPRDLTAEEERLLAPILKIREAPARDKRRRYEIVVFLDRFPATMSTSDFKQIGPFNRGDLAKIPAEDARELEAKGIVKRLRLL
ncbi:hypothetical protein [Thermoproteus tenax]|uniref:DNA replication initiation complex subunit, GINS family n=1 Tax=Thermoproteus tenax (strain ATCC 35583 / DSM 2078 / JCM 9277 / NBRC 100435 / Kra 1) TaxID=768679 RepID=G4RNU8_THETK|nr:hypothetical protein [Thermoproteus tenax]CCC81242.1 DNA replication initiation complex subunit, GINS family [Thermoproteus tenax Kra 1]